MQEEVKQKKKWYKKWWVWVLVVLLIGGIDGTIGGASSNGENKPTTGDNDNTQETIYHLNDVVISGDLEAIVTSVTNTKYIGDELLGEGTENNFIIVTVKLKNNGSKEKYLSGSNFYLFDGKNRYEPHTAGIHLKDTGFYLNTTIGSGISKTISIVYEIPAEYVKGNYYVNISDGIFEKDAKVYLNK